MSTRPSFRFPLDHLDLYASPLRPSGPQLDRHQIFTRPDRDGRTTVVQSDLKELG
ncbi:hypothetical protein DPMN_149330 [Dreissena polymorpha]|uniref:Uncharacterized protein n=1 Tax=Dreissena polymorpha TaxID=45954 RepID=A0A9D4J2C3_DREPO|nr:hypothetical protein DPMN_149330 [Dreissena polymorpha]